MKRTAGLSKHLIDLVDTDYFAYNLTLLLKNAPRLFSFNDNHNVSIIDNLISFQANFKKKKIPYNSFSSFNQLCVYLLKELNIDVDSLSLLTGIKNNLLISFLNGRRSCINFGAKNISKMLALCSIPLQEFENFMGIFSENDPITSLALSNSAKFIGTEPLVRGSNGIKYQRNRSFKSFIERLKNELILRGRKDLL